MRTFDKRIYFYIGTVAELIKLSSVLREFDKKKIPFSIITTGQNEIKFQELEKLIGKKSAKIEFPVKPKESSVIKFFLWTIKTVLLSIFKLRNEFTENNQNTLVFVHGDTISALIGAITAKVWGAKVLHIESGLRSFHFSEPFPEELTRVAISHLADVHFCPNTWAKNNIQHNKGIKLVTNQNTLFETCMKAIKMPLQTTWLKRLKKEKYFVLVMHRQEHVMYKKELAKQLINRMVRFASSNIKCVIVLHKLTENFLIEQGMLTEIKRNKQVIVIPRLPYLEFIHIINKAQFIATDGGSNQEEAYYLGKPGLILRKFSERIEGLGANIILAKDNLSVIDDFLVHYKHLRRKKIVLRRVPSTVISAFILNL